MTPPFATLAQAREAYRIWLFDHALPLWWQVGFDHAGGGVLEALSVEGAPLPAARRGRVQGRQVYTYATAGELGWHGPWLEAAWAAQDYGLSRFRRPDGLYRTLVGLDGAALDETATLYDQAFAMMGMATLFGQDRARGDLVAAADQIRRSMEGLRHPAGGFREADDHPFQANAHMHILEAAMAWGEVDETGWDPLAAEVVEMALRIFIDPKGGFVREFFDADWAPAPGEDGRLVEPGHQFEWAWLLTRYGRKMDRTDICEAAQKMYQVGLIGIDAVRRVAINALWDDYSPRDQTARLWPQTEWLKAALILGDEKNALAAANSLAKYLATPVTGVWFDKLTPDGSFVAEPAPASSFYHITCAVRELLLAPEVNAV